MSDINVETQPKFKAVTEEWVTSDGLVEEVESAIKAYNEDPKADLRDAVKKAAEKAIANLKESESALEKDTNVHSLESWKNRPSNGWFGDWIAGFQELIDYCDTLTF